MSLTSIDQIQKKKKSLRLITYESDLIYKKKIIKSVIIFALKGKCV